MALIEVGDNQIVERRDRDWEGHTGEARAGEG